MLNVIVYVCMCVCVCVCVCGVCVFSVSVDVCNPCIFGGTKRQKGDPWIFVDPKLGCLDRLNKRFMDRSGSKNRALDQSDLKH